MRALIRNVAGVRVLRYLLASLFSLGIDIGCFLVLLRIGTAPMPASAAGYALGIVAHWWVSSRAVFADSVADAGPERTRQKALFVASALAGLAMTTLVVGAGAALGLDPRLAKLAAIALSFALTWLLRRQVVFA